MSYRPFTEFVEESKETVQPKINKTNPVEGECQQLLNPKYTKCLSNLYITQHSYLHLV